jgi:hypothetical protein
MIYDFNKDMLVEGNKNEIVARVDYILNNSKEKNNIINIDKDEKYSFTLFKNSKEGKRNSNEKKENDEIINEKNTLISEEKLFAKRISDAISSQKDEYELKIFKTYTIMTFLIILICLLIIFLINHYFYNKLKSILTILKNIISVRYCKSLSIYYIRELILLNFNIPNLNGGKYSNIPSFNRTKFENLIKNKLLEYFLENQSSLKQILSSDYSLSKSFENDLSKEKFESKYMTRLEIGSIEGDALSILMQYNSILYNIASSFTPVYQNNSEVFNFLHNGFNNFEKAIEYIWKKYNLELDLQKKNIIIYFIISSIIIIILFIISSYLMVTSFISAARRRISYIQVFYGISTDSIKKLMSNCDKLINKLKKDNHNNIEEEDMLDESDEDKNIFQKQIQNENDLRNTNITKSQESNNNIIISLASKLFFIFYILFMMGMYTYFPYAIYYLYNLSNKTIGFSFFIMQLNTFDMDVIETFNVYREFLFDNKTRIEDLTSYEYLMKREIEGYKKISYNVNSISNFIFANNLHLDPTVAALFGKHICSYYITDIFNSTEQCKNKFGKIVNYEFSIIMANFLQKIRNTKNIVRYKHQKELIFGELAMYEESKWETWNNSFFGEEDTGTNDKKKSFKLDLFNNDTLHSDINLLFINLLMPYLEENRIEVDKRATIDGEGKYFSKIFLLFLIVFLLMYIAYLLPMINYISTFIYKTKNMLLLIPMTILSSQSNIKSLLNLT